MLKTTKYITQILNNNNKIKIIINIHTTPHNLWMRANRKAYVNGIFCPIVPRRDKQRLAHKNSVETFRLRHKHWSAGSPTLAKAILTQDQHAICCQMKTHDNVTHICQSVHLSNAHIFTQKTFVILWHTVYAMSQLTLIGMKSNFSNALMAEWCLYQRIGTDQYLNTCNTFNY